MGVRADITRGDQLFIGTDRTLRFLVAGEEAVTAAVWAAGQGTITLVRAHAWAPGRKARLRGFLPDAWNGDHSVVSVPAPEQAVLAITPDPGAVRVLGYALDVPQDVTSWALRWELRENPDDVDTVFFKASPPGAGITKPDPTDGLVAVAIGADDTRALDPGTYFHTLKRTDAGAESALSWGWVELLHAATR